MKIWKYILVCFSLLVLSCAKQEVRPELPSAAVKIKQQYALGELSEVELQTDAAIDTTALKLFLESGVYQAKLNAKSCENGSCVFQIPELIASKTGLGQWRLFYKDHQLQAGSYTITATEDKDYRIGTYIGPPSEKAGTPRATMAVAIPTDSHGNLIRIADSVQMNFRYLNRESTYLAPIAYGLAHYEIDAGPLTGELQLGGLYKGAKAKAANFMVMPNEATDFSLVMNPQHQIADGQQELKINTNIIRDRFGNTVADGTAVELLVQQSDGVRNTVSGTTANGIARFTLLHPDSAMDWTLQASVTNGAISNTTTLSFQAFTNELPLELNENGLLTVGPIIGTLNQRVTDGIYVQVFDASNTLLMEKQTKNGLVYFDLNELSKNPKRPLRVTAMGLNQIIE